MHHRRVIDEDTNGGDAVTSLMTYANLRRTGGRQGRPTGRLMDSSRADVSTLKAWELLKGHSVTTAHGSVAVSLVFEAEFLSFVPV